MSSPTANKVRGLAARWEQQPSTSASGTTGTSPPKRGGLGGRTSPRGRGARAGGPNAPRSVSSTSTTANGRGSPSPRLTSPRSSLVRTNSRPLSPTKIPAPLPQSCSPTRTTAPLPPTAFKSIDPKSVTSKPGTEGKPLVRGRGRSGTVTAPTPPPLITKVQPQHEHIVEAEDDDDDDDVTSDVPLESPVNSRKGSLATTGIDDIVPKATSPLPPAAALPVVAPTTESMVAPEPALEPAPPPEAPALGNPTTTIEAPSPTVPSSTLPRSLLLSSGTGLHEPISLSAGKQLHLDERSATPVSDSGSENYAEAVELSSPLPASPVKMAPTLAEPPSPAGSSKRSLSFASEYTESHYSSPPGSVFHKSPAPSHKPLADDDKPALPTLSPSNPYKLLLDDEKPTLPSSSPVLPPQPLEPEPEHEPEPEPEPEPHLPERPTHVSQQSQPRILTDLPARTTSTLDRAPSPNHTPTRAQPVPKVTPASPIDDETNPSANTSADHAQPTTPPLLGDDFSHVSLSADPSPSAPARTFPSIFSRVLPDYAATPKDQRDKDRDSPSSVSSNKKPNFFSTATAALNSLNNLNLPSVNLPSVTRERSAEGTPTPEPVQHNHHSPGAASPSTNWRTTMSNFLTSRVPAPSSPSATPPPVPPTPTRNGSTSTVFILNRIDSASAAHDRRQSREGGGGDRIREGFERVRNEMECTAREIRREAAGGEDTNTSAVDWAFWGAVVQDYEDVARTRPKDLSRAIQQGIPPVIRGPIWQLMSSSKSTELEETYKALLKLTSPHEKAIHKDISRTFPTHKFFQGAGAGQESLFMVVKAYSLYDREVGYTQGLAFIVAALLLNMPDEEAFCVLVRLMDSYNLRSHYLADMPGLQLRLYQFDRLVEEILPLLHNHLVRKGIKSSMFASQWFMTLFSYRFPLSLVYRVFDIVLAEGIEAIFRFSLALLKRSEDELVQLDFDQLLVYLQGDLFEVYRAPEGESHGEGSTPDEDMWRTNDFVRDAYEIRTTPLMLDQYEAEWNEKCRAQTAHARELEVLRTANRHLSGQVKTLEASLATMNQEHVELVRQLVLAKIAKEDMENELVKYKSMCAQLAQRTPDEVDHIASHPSQSSLYGLGGPGAVGSASPSVVSPGFSAGSPGGFDRSPGGFGVGSPIAFGSGVPAMRASSTSVNTHTTSASASHSGVPHE